MLKLDLGEVTECNPALKIGAGSSRKESLSEPNEPLTSGEVRKRLGSAKQACLDLGHIEKTEDFGGCVLRLMEMN